MNKKNIVVFMTDQQNAKTICTNSVAKTPNVDRFLKNAMNFTQAYCPAPHCCPSRATFFSGLYPAQHGIWHNVEVDSAISRELFDGVKLFPELLLENGYNTIFSGKWHVSGTEGPAQRGFQKVLRECSTNYGRDNKGNVPRFNDWEKLYCKREKIDKSNEIKSDGRIIKEGYPSYYQYGIEENPFGDSDTVKLACEEIENYKSDKPFFMYVGTIGPHDPYYVPQEFLDMYKDVELSLPESFSDTMEDKPALYRRTREQFSLSKEEYIESMRRYLAFVSYEDSLFGNLIDSLEKKGIMDDTVVIYLTDHGDYLGAHGLWAKGLPCFKEAYNICAVIGGGNITTKGENDELVSLADFSATILDIAQVPNNLNMYGKSLVPFLKKEKQENWREYICTQTNGNEVYGIQRAVWDKKWKYVYNSFDYDELYDLENDPDEMINVCKKPENKAKVKEMCKKMWQFAYDTKDCATCGYIMVRMAPYGPGIIFED